MVQKKEVCTKIQIKWCKKGKYAPKLKRNGAKKESMHQNSDEMVQKRKVCTKTQTKWCKKGKYAPKLRQKGAKEGSMHQNPDKKVQKKEVCTKIQTKKCKKGKYAPKLRQKGAKQRSMHQKNEKQCKNLTTEKNSKKLNRIESNSERTVFYQAFVYDEIKSLHSYLIIECSE